MAQPVRLSRRGKNPAGIDTWLDTLGFYRKNVAYDETCLFRAVSEQLFYTQVNHEEIRKKCISYGKRYSKEFRHMIVKKKDWGERLKNLKLHMLVCNEVEIQLICKVYRVDIEVFNSTDQNRIIYRGHPQYTGEQLLHLCKTTEDHYDAVYTKEHIDNAGFCQSIIYKALYEDVFSVSNVDAIVHSMLHDKQSPFATYYPLESGQIKEECSEDDETASIDLIPFFPNRQQNAAPFPFKIAKALDPNMYRNIEYDTWLELRRELRLGQWYYGDDKLILGTRCIVTIGNEAMQCYIQSILEQDKLYEVYITKLAQRLIVSYHDLRPEEDAKPWPLPFRFARNQTMQLTNDLSVAAPVDNDYKGLRKRREKKRLQSFTEENPQGGSKDGFTDVNVSNYEGCPLVSSQSTLVESNKHICQSPTAECKIERLTLNLSTPCYSSEPRDEHNQVACNISETISWSEHIDGLEENFPSSNFTENIMAQSTPTSYPQDFSESPLMYSYDSESGYPTMHMWPAPPPYVISPDSALSEGNMSPMVDYRQSPQKFMYYQTDSAYTSPTFIQSPLPYQPIPFSPNPVATSDRVIYAAPPSPASSPMDIYPIVYPMSTPGTPIYYPQPTPTPVPTPQPQDYAVSPLPVYSAPTAELQYMNSPSYIYPPMYPPTPPVAWYNPSHINTQGFVFPPAVNN